MLKDLIQEMAAGGAAGVTSAGAIAGFREPIGSKTAKKGKKKKKMQRRNTGFLGFHFVGEGAGFGRFLQEAEDSDFDRSDVIAKLKSAAKSAEEKGEDSAGFALEDENGSMVKVWVPEDQADSFAQALQTALAGADEDEDDQNDSIEIAEVLWKLRKQYDIVNVEWGDIPEDQEEVVDTEAGAAAPMDAAGGETEAAPGGAEGVVDTGEEGGDMTAEPGEAADLGAEPPGEEAAASALTQVIDMMKADAEARKAEAEARAAEAASRTAAEKVKQEEEVLDMEAYYDDKKEAEKEAKQIAKLAKYKHDLAADEGEGLSSEAPPPEAESEPNMGLEPGPEEAEPEMEEVPRPRADRAYHSGTTISKGELMNMLLMALRRQ